MKNFNTKFILPLALLGFICVASITSCDSGPGDKTGDELKSYLHDHTAPKDETKNFYDYNSLVIQYKTSDNDPEKEGNVVLFYTSRSYEWVPWGQLGDTDNSVQREHVWPQSRFRIYGNSTTEQGKATLDSKLSPYNDAHNVRPSWGKDNKEHSNTFYGESSTLFDPNRIEGYDQTHSYRGDIARIVFYMAVRYDKLELVDTTNESTTDSYQLGKLSYLLDWNLKNPVSDREKQRNDAIEKGKQGNRNPFIDHPEYACKIWGSKTEETKKVCGLE